MSKSPLMAGLRIVIAVVMMIAVVPFASHSASPHTPAVFPVVGDAQLAGGPDIGNEGHAHDGHAHDDDADEERTLGHVHGHNPADHSHVAMSPAVFPKALIHPAGAGWENGPSHAVGGGPSFPLDRPPRSSTAA